MIQTLDSLKFSYKDHTLIGSLRSCLDYLNIDVSDDWLYGMSGAAFLMVTDRSVSTDATAYGYEPGMVYRLAENLGIRVRGIHRVEDPADREGLIASAWQHAKRAIDHGYPCFSFELEEGHEHAIIFGYDDEGYLSHGWHQRGTESIPWQKLGQKVCPCDQCRNYRKEKGSSDEARFIDLHWVEPGPKEENKTEAFKQMLAFVFQITSDRDWVYKDYAVGLQAYDHIIHATEKGTAVGKHIGYTLEMYSEARRHAPIFLKDMSKEVSSAPAALFDRAIGAYELVSDLLQAASELYPWKQPFAPIGVNETSKQAAKLLKEAKEAEAEGLDALQGIYHALKK